MIYEIILTAKCSRTCNFCYIRQSGYIESEDNVRKFVNEVKNSQFGKNEIYDISMFGGEPFLNVNGIEIISKSFSEDWRSNLHIVSNGDLIDDKIGENIRKCFLHLSTYDIFDVQKRSRYLSICRMFRKSVCLYTMTEDDLPRYDEIKELYRDMGVDFHIHLSHDPCSWKSTSTGKLYDAIYKIASSELSEYLGRFSNENPAANDFVEQHVKRYINWMNWDSDEILCTDSRTKKTFYMGEFIGPCIRLRGIEPRYSGSMCRKCEYFKMCQKGCFAEINDDVDEKLCTLEKARFDAVKDFLKSNENDKNVMGIVQFYKDYLGSV